MEVLAAVVIHRVEDIKEARQTARDICKEAGFTLLDQTRIVTVVSELARNIYLYAGQGQILLYKQQNHRQVGVRITANDKGPGIIDVHKVMDVGFSTSGGLGAGLPGVKNLMDEFSIESSSDKGTSINTIKWLR